MPKFQNNTKGVSRVGHICKVDPNTPNAFLYVANNTSFALGVIAEAVPYRAYAEVITQGEALVYVNDNVRKDDLIRTQKSDNITTGSCKVVKTGDAPYLRVGTALQSGKGLVRVSLKWEYIATESTGDFQPLDADLTRLADYRRIGGDTDYIGFGADGQITLVGDARVYEGVWLDPAGLKAPSVKPATYIDHGITGAWQFVDGDTNNLVFNIRIPDDMDRSVAPYLLIGWSTSTTVITETAVWQLEYLYTALGEDTSAVAQDTLEVLSNAIAQSHGLIAASITGLDLVGADDVCMHCRLERLGADGDDDLTDTAELHGVCLRYVANKIGEAI